MNQRLKIANIIDAVEAHQSLLIKATQINLDVLFHLKL